MKIGVGLKRAEQIYNVDYLRFLRQVGVTHIVGYKCEADQIPSSKYGYWSQEDLSAMCKHYKDNGLVLEGIENLPVHHWMKVLHDLPGREKQMDNIKYTGRAVVFGDKCISCMGCLQYCPQEAINVGKITEKRERYHNANITPEDLTKDMISF